MLSIVIPTRNEQYLLPTIRDLLSKAQGEIEIIVAFDGPPYQSLPAVPNVRELHLRQAGMRPAIAAAADIARGDYLMKIDGHCIVDNGFDVKLAADCDENWVIIPRRYRLDVENWVVEEATEEKPPVDYQYFIYPRKYKPMALHGYRWEDRGRERKDCLIDDTLTFQGSCWFMHRSHFERHAFMRDEGYQGLPQQEAEEIALTTWMTGGRVVVNKKTWYAHWFKGKENGQGYPTSKRVADACYAYSFNHWVIERRAGFEKVIGHFWPIPGWPENWREKIYR